MTTRSSRSAPALAAKPLHIKEPPPNKKEAAPVKVAPSSGEHKDTATRNRESQDSPKTLLNGGWM